MELFVTGRILDGNTLIGYKVWALNSNNVLEYKIIRKDEVQKLFEKYHVRNCEYNKSTNGLKSKLTIPISEYPRYNKWMGLSTKNQYTDSHIIAMTLNKRVDDIRFMVCGALVYGAITDPLSERARKHAETYYEEIRHMKTDVQRIAKNTGFSEQDINRVKNYLFMESHQLADGYRRFDSSFEIASSWQRLMQNKIEPHDITLLSHELLEMSLIESGMEQRTAHNYAENQFNYGKESNEYYDRLKKHN